jgi:hypothetical protein
MLDAATGFLFSAIAALSAREKAYSMEVAAYW